MNIGHIFDFDNYRSAIDHLIAKRKTAGEKLSRRKLAEAIGVHASFFSHVMTGKAELSQDQCFLIIQYFQLNDLESEYFSMLVEVERTGLQDRKSHLLSKLRQTQNSWRQAEKRLKAPTYSDEDFLQRYFTTPYLQQVHIGLSIKKYSSDPDLLRRDLGLNSRLFSELLVQLESLDLVESKNGLAAKKIHVSLPKSHSLYKVWTQLIRDLSKPLFFQSSADENFTYTVTFSTNEEVKTKIRNRFLQFLQEVEAEVVESNPESLYQLNFDLLSWVSSKNNK